MGKRGDRTNDAFNKKREYGGQQITIKGDLSGIKYDHEVLKSILKNSDLYFKKFK